MITLGSIIGLGLTLSEQDLSLFLFRAFQLPGRQGACDGQRECRCARRDDSDGEGGANFRLRNDSGREDDTTPILLLTRSGNPSPNDLAIFA